jgi:hypothetical protein
VGVSGMVVELTHDELGILDSYEGGYSRVQRIVVLKKPDGTTQRRKCHVYIKDNYAYTSPPSVAYLSAIRLMLDQCNRAQKKNIAVRGVITNEENQKRKKLKTFGFFKNGKLCTCKEPILSKVRRMTKIKD